MSNLFRRYSNYRLAQQPSPRAVNKMPLYANSGMRYRAGYSQKRATSLPPFFRHKATSDNLTGSVINFVWSEKVSTPVFRRRRSFLSYPASSETRSFKKETHARTTVAHYIISHRRRSSIDNHRRRRRLSGTSVHMQRVHRCTTGARVHIYAHIRKEVTGDS